MKTDIFTYKNTTAHSSEKNGQPPGGMLAGKKIVIQPNMSARGWLTDAGSRALEGFIALEDATMVARLRNAGAELIGSSRMSELGFGLTGDTAAQAILAGADMALITDTMGETRVSAAMSGLFGFKPSFGIVSRFGLIGLVPSMECSGIIAKNINDISAVMAVVSGKDEHDFSMPDETMPDFADALKPVKKTYHVGIIRECISSLDETEKKAFNRGISKFEKAGFSIQEISLKDFSLFRAVHNVIGSVEASSSAGKFDGVRYGHRSPVGKNWNDMYLNSRGESFGTLVKTYLFQGAYFQFENYRAFENACRIRRRLVREISDIFNHVDLVALPTRRPAHDASKAVGINETYNAFYFTIPANTTGQPSLQIPSLAVDSEFDIGIQLTGPRLSDVNLLAAGMKLSSVTEGER